MCIINGVCLEEHAVIDWESCKSLEWILDMASNNNANCINTCNKRTLYLCQVSPLPRDFFHGVTSVQFSRSVVSDSATPWTAAHQASLSITNSWSLLKVMSIESVMPSNHLILCRPLLLPPSIFPSIRVFPNESVLCIRWPKDWSFSLDSHMRRCFADGSSTCFSYQLKHWFQIIRLKTEVKPFSTGSECLPLHSI